MHPAGTAENIDKMQVQAHRISICSHSPLKPTPRPQHRSCSSRGAVQAQAPADDAGLLVSEVLRRVKGTGVCGVLVLEGTSTTARAHLHTPHTHSAWRGTGRSDVEDTDTWGTVYLTRQSLCIQSVRGAG